MRIWATQVRNLGWKSPKNNHSHEISNPSCFWQDLKFRGNGSCRKTSVWCWPAPGKERGPGKGNRTSVAVCFHAFEKVWVWLKPGKSTWGFYFVPAFSNTIHLTHEALNIRRKQGRNKSWLFLMFKHTLNRTPCWEREQDTAGGRCRGSKGQHGLFILIHYGLVLCQAWFSLR